MAGEFSWVAPLGDEWDLGGGEGADSELRIVQEKTAEVVKVTPGGAHDNAVEHRVR